MQEDRKKKIDSLWRNTDYGQWVLSMISGEENEAEKITEKIAGKFPFTLSNCDREISKIIADEINDEAEFDEYLKALDEENPELIEFMISHDTFGSVYQFLSDK